MFFFRKKLAKKNRKEQNTICSLLTSANMQDFVMFYYILQAMLSMYNRVGLKLLIITHFSSEEEKPKNILLCFNPTSWFGYLHNCSRKTLRRSLKIQLKRHNSIRIDACLNLVRFFCCSCFLIGKNNKFRGVGT